MVPSHGSPPAPPLPVQGLPPVPLLRPAAGRDSARRQCSNGSRTKGSYLVTLISEDQCTSEVNGWHNLAVWPGKERLGRRCSPPGGRIGRSWGPRRGSRPEIPGCSEGKRGRGLDEGRVCGRQGTEERQREGGLGAKRGFEVWTYDSTSTTRTTQRA